MAKPTKLTDSQIRGWILSDEQLYLQAREFGGGGDDEMYEKIYEFIKKNRKMLVNHINQARAGV